MVGRFQVASEKYGTLNIRSVHRAQHIYQQMPADIIWTRNNFAEIRELATAADVIHYNNNYASAHRRVVPWGKPALLHHHGSLFRNNPKDLLAKARHLGAVQAVSTVDLMHIAPHLLHWLPTAYDVDSLVEFGAKHRRKPDGRIRVVSCPTNRVYKSTAALEAAVAKLQADGLPVDLVIVEGKPWAEAMAIKATADIYFDQVILGYGCNAVEAWGMGIPVIAGADEWTLAKMTELWGRLPFYTATEATIGDAIATLAGSKAKRTGYAKAGMAHVRRHHDELPALARLAELYSMAIHRRQEATVQPEYPTVTFRAKVPQLRAAGKYVTFVNGEHTTTNPYIATALRALSLRYPKYGITEVVSEEDAA